MRNYRTSPYNPARNERAFAAAERAWLEPPEDDIWECRECDEENNGGDECHACEEPKPDFEEEAADARAEEMMERHRDQEFDLDREEW